MLKVIEKNPRPLSFQVVPKLLDHIGLAMYSKLTKAIGELVINGYDADAKLVKVDIAVDKVTIRDNGKGMSEKDIRHEYMMIGSDHKRKTKRTKIFNRLPIGNKGIGKLAGLGIAKKMTVRTIQNNICYTYLIDREELQKVSTLDQAKHNLKVERANRQPGTTIELTKLMPHVKIDIEDLRGYLAREIPQSENFSVLVNGLKCLKKDIPAKKKIPVNIYNDVCGLISGEVIVAKKALTQIEPGILTTVRGRVVGVPNHFGLTRSAHRFYYSFSALLTGSVEVSAFDPEDEVDDFPVIKTDRGGFNEDHPKYKAYYKEMTELLISIAREEEKELEKKKEDEVKAKVNDALKNVINDLNAFNKQRQQQVVDYGKKKGVEDELSQIEVTKNNGHQRESNNLLAQQENPILVVDQKLQQELKAARGFGSINLGNRNYKITLAPLGIDDYECQIDDKQRVININISHPAYDQAVAERCVEITVFRAIAESFACKDCKTSGEMYEQLDEMIRFQATKMEERRFKKQSK